MSEDFPGCDNFLSDSVQVEAGETKVFSAEEARVLDCRHIHGEARVLTNCKGDHANCSENLELVFEASPGIESDKPDENSESWFKLPTRKIVMDGINPIRSAAEGYESAFAINLASWDFVRLYSIKNRENEADADNSATCQAYLRRKRGR